MSWPWSELGLSGPADLAEVRRAYAERLKTTHPEENPEGFQRLHKAYQEARRLARKGGAGARPASSDVQQKQADEQAEEFDWDYDSLLQQDEFEKEPEDEEPDWDYEGIFTELADERAREREAHAGERRTAYFIKHNPATPEERERLERQWANLEKAEAAVEELSVSGAPLYVWISFLHSSVFFAVKGDEDFVAWLEQFLRGAADLDEQIKRELSKAFGLRHGEVPPIWQGLNELLNGVKKEPKEGEKQPKKGRAGVAAAVALALLVLIPGAFYLVSRLSADPGQGERERLCQYMEEDFGRVVESRWKGRANYENLYALWDQPEVTFMAWPDGERDPAAGKRGYTTNFSSVMVTQALEDFTREWGFELEQLQEGGVDGVMGTFGTSPGAYILKLPLRGAEEGIEALGGLMAELEAQPWYTAFPPSYELHFAYQNLTYLTYTSEGPFNGAAVLDYYENEAGCALCAFLAEQSGLAQEDFGGAGFQLEPQGSVELAGKPWFLVSGLDLDSGETVRQYIFDGIYLTSFPAEGFNTDLKAYELSADRFNSTWEDVPPFLWISRK